MKRLAVLYPPCGAEYEYYLYGEPISAELRICLMGARCHGGDNEHDPRNMHVTASLDNLLQAARVMEPLRPDAIMWACTSGSFIDGLGHAKAQASAMSDLLGCPASSTSLAFVEALQALEFNRATVLGSYPDQTTRAFTGFMSEAGIEICDYCALDMPSGPQAALLGEKRLTQAARTLNTPKDAALLIPDTAMPTLHLIRTLSESIGRTVLTANQVSIWSGARMLGLESSLLD